MSMSLSSKSEMRSAFLDSNMKVTTSPVSSAFFFFFFKCKEGVAVEVERESGKFERERRASERAVDDDRRQLDLRIWWLA